jgi:hypothetical protein
MAAARPSGSSCSARVSAAATRTAADACSGEGVEGGDGGQEKELLAGRVGGGVYPCGRAGSWAGLMAWSGISRRHMAGRCEMVKDQWGEWSTESAMPSRAAPAGVREGRRARACVLARACARVLAGGRAGGCAGG